MKKKYFISLLIIVLFSYSFVIAGDDKDRIGVEGPLSFNNTSFNLAWSDKARDNYYIQEYLPAGEQVESFVQMMSLHVFLIDMSIDDAVQIKLNELDKRSKTDDVCKGSVNETVSSDGKETLVDFLLSEKQKDTPEIVEYNVYRYIPVNIGDGENGILVYAYTKRAYGKDAEGFIDTINKDRRNIVEQMGNTEVPKVKIPE
ncbi:MAG TPA: hypothetical protein PKA90_04995 [Ignavibacteria bacterium]|nr:hypothetical protein [Ignavibacteria bacterium]